MNKIQRFLKYFLGLSLLAMNTFVNADWALNLPEGVTDISHEVYDLHMIVLWVCVGIGVVVFGAMIISIIYHRKSRGVTPATFHESMTAEITWSIIPLIILIALGIPAAKTLIAMEDNSDSDLTVKITGHQWKWEYEYMDSGLKFISSLDSKSREAATINSGIDPYTVENYLLEVDEPLVLPTHKKIRFLLTASDVLHSWWVPDFAVKKDAVPGFITSMWTKINEEGTYRGQCTELCGKDHGFMPIVVEAKSNADYEAWVQAKIEEQNKVDVTSQRTLAELIEIGEAVYGKFCAACHQPDGTGVPGAFPALAGNKIVTDDMNTHIDIVFNGKPGTSMAAYKNQLNSLDLAAVITYERNAWGNNTKEAVQPATLEAMRN